MLRCGIVGLPNVGKSTLFNALTQAGVAASNYPFCTIKPNVGVVPVPDARLDRIAAIAQSKTVIPATMQFVDIAGLVAGAAQGEGLGNQFLANIRNTAAIVQVVRCFEDSDVSHVSGQINPVDDVNIIHLELALADLATAEKALLKLEKEARSGHKKTLAAIQVLSEVQQHLSKGDAVRSLPLTQEASNILQPYQFLTQKPMLYVANVDEAGLTQSPYLDQLSAFCKKEKEPVLAICAAIEAEIIELTRSEQEAFLKSLGLEEPGLDRLIRASYALLGLETYFTAGPKEARAWTIPKAATAAEAAGVIHTDFQKGFICAEVVSFSDYIQCQGEQGAKAAGKWRQEGKNYSVQDGDVILFRFNV